MDDDVDWKQLNNNEEKENEEEEEEEAPVVICLSLILETRTSLNLVRCLLFTVRHECPVLS